MHETMTELASPAIAIPSQDLSSGVTGAVIDMRGFDELALAIDLGAKTSGTTEIKVQECATSDGTFVDVADAAGDITLTGVYWGRVRWDRRLRYAKVIADDGGTGHTGCVIAIRGMARKVPSSVAELFDA